MESAHVKKLKKAGCNALQWTWGLPQTLAGAALYLAHRGDRHFDWRGTRATAWDRPAGVSLGRFIFVPKSKANDSFLLDHEYGHTIQSLMLGPFYLLLVGLPSLLWSRLPYFARKRKQSGKSYYSAPFEKSANQLASRARR